MAITRTTTITTTITSISTTHPWTVVVGIVLRGSSYGHGDDDDNGNGCLDDDMSIGARAALQDHLRQVAKYGVEGKSNHDNEQQENHDPNNSMSNMSPQDILWNQLLDDSIPPSSQQQTLVKPKQQSPQQLQQQLQISIRHNDTTSNGHHPSDDSIDDDYVDEAIEVSLINTSCCYSDYFNTSKVLLLATPEKNKTQRPPFRITSRNHVK